MIKIDISLELGEQKLNIRAALIINHNNKILVHSDKKSDHSALIGGRVKIGEDSEETIKREILEEMGKEIEITGYIATIENFFEMKGKKYHEIMFVHQGDFINEEDKKLETAIKNIEGKESLTYEWVEIDRLDEILLKPVTIIEILKNKKFPIHKINNDFKLARM